MNSSIVYRDYCDADIDAVVEMWKESRPGWPPGFFGASEISASSVAQEEKSSGRLFTVLAFLGERVVGYCRTSPYGGEADASYVDLINVVPDMHGMGVGKALLLNAVNRSVEFGMNRIDLHTWPANLKAVPLYKKTGFFWVPDTMVYMQNYIPFLLGRDEFVTFLEGEDWYSCFERALLVEPDVEKTDAGREVFRYIFKRNSSTFIAEFDRKGRCLSAIEYPGFSAALSLEREVEEFFVGTSYKVILTGSGFNHNLVKITSGKSLLNTALIDGTFCVEPVSVRLPKLSSEPADRVSLTFSESDLEIGLGLVGVEEVTLQSNPICFVSPNAKELKLGVKKLADVSSVEVSYSVDDGEFYSRVVALNSDIYQSCVIELPPIQRGIHTLSLRLGESGYLETLILIYGVYNGSPVTLDTRKLALIVGRDVVLSVSRRGASGNMWGPGESSAPLHLGKFCIIAGPPSAWNSDLPRQNYEFELGEGQVTARTSWPSRPGMTHWVSVRLDPSGFAETFGGVDNGSDAVQKILFRVIHGSGQSIDPKIDLLPLPGGLLVERRIFNQIPDWDEDLSSLVSNLGAPWTGVTGGGKSLMNYFPLWKELEYDSPGVPEVDVSPGESLMSPSFSMLCVNGSVKNLMLRAESLGWETGNWKKKTGFLKSNLNPIMASGSEVSLSHMLYGEREGQILASCEEIASGKIKNGVSILGNLYGDGAVDVSLCVAKRDTVKPVYLVDPLVEKVTLEDNSGNLMLSNGRVVANIDSLAFGHVYSVKLDSVEYILSSHPEPSTFAWEKPWYGGILPRILDGRSNPYPMQKERPLVAEYEEEICGLVEKGWVMRWKINHKKYGSLNVIWKVGLLPGVPVLKTSLSCAATSGEYLNAEIDLRGFIQPGGSVEEGVLTCDLYPGLVQGRKHAGTWAGMGKWARVQRQNSFVEVYSTGDGEFFCEDYAKQGCHFSVFSNREKKKNLAVSWLFGASEEDETLASVFRADR